MIQKIETEKAESLLCRHCGLPVARGSRAYCCSGCFLAQHLLSRTESGDQGPADRLLARLVVSAFLAMGVMVFSLSLYGMEGEVTDQSAQALQGLFRLGALLLSAPVFLLLGIPLADAVLHLRRLSADLLILLGVSAAWLVSMWNTFFEGPHVYFETATMVLVLFTLGRWLDARTREQARERLSVLARERLGNAVRISRGLDSNVDPDSLQVGDVVRVRPGELVPVDGEVLEGRSFLDTSSLTGEQKPRSVGPGDDVLADTRTVDGCLLVQATAVSGSRVSDEIQRLLAESTGKRAKLVHLADRASAIFLPCVLLLAIGTLLWHWTRSGPEAACLHGLSVLLIACPCALGLATPLAFWVALGEAWQQGLLVRGGEVFERLARARQILFDKTGTLTTGQMKLRSIHAYGAVSEQRALELAASLERNSEHPIARALHKAASANAEGLPAVTDFRTIAGVGVSGTIEGMHCRLERAPREFLEVDDVTRVRLSADEEPVAEFALQVSIRNEAPEVVAVLKARGLQPAVLTGDARGPALALQRALQLPVHGELLPDQKVARLRSKRADGVIFVGDGLNDAPVLAAADVGISMGSGSATSLESASVNLLGDDLRLIPQLLDLAQAAVNTARLNLVWALSYNVIGLWFAATGRLTPIFASTAMVASSLLVVLNSARLKSKSTADEYPSPENWMDAREPSPPVAGVSH